MIRRMFLFSVMLCIVAEGLAVDPSDTKAVDGVWVVEKAEMDGNDITPALTRYVLTLDNGRYTLDDKGNKDEGLIRLDDSRSPRQMDIIGGPKSPFTGKTFPCIYDVKGGKLTVCYGMDFKTRPTEFQTAKESHRMLAVYTIKK